jgi:hypothetical protein
VNPSRYDDERQNIGDENVGVEELAGAVGHNKFFLAHKYLLDSLYRPLLS